jgi:hypothetical protein
LKPACWSRSYVRWNGTDASGNNNNTTNNSHNNNNKNNNNNINKDFHRSSHVISLRPNTYSLVPAQ